MEKIKKFMNKVKFKWLKETLGTAIIIAILIAVFIGINVLVGIWDPSDIDMTDEKLYSLTDESKNIIKSLPDSDKFNIYMFDYEEDNNLVEFAKEYTRINNNITLEIVKSEERPDLISEYEVLANYGSVVITCGDRNLTFNYYDFYNYDMYTGEYTDITEQRFTNSIVGLSSIGERTTIYELTGHNEISLSKDMTVLNTYLELENYEIKQLDLLTKSSVPEDCKTLVIASPGKDITEVEREALKKYINEGGNIFWLSNPYSCKEESPNLNSVLELFGIKIRQDGLMIEQNLNKMIMNTPDMILTTVNSSEITSEISNVLLFDSGKLEISDSSKLMEIDCQRTDLLTSSKDAFFRTDLERGFNRKQDDETASEEVLACLMEKDVQEGAKKSKLIVVANNLFAQDYPIPVGNSTVASIGFYDNMSFSQKCIGYLSEVGDTLTITKDIKIVPYTATDTQDIIIKIIIFTIPVLIIIAGIVVWTIRRRKK